MDQNGAKRYSTALFEVARSKGKIDEFLEQMREVNMVFKDNHELTEILSHPNVQLKDKKYIVRTAFKGRVDDEIVELMAILLEHGKINEFINITLYYRDIAYEYKGIKIAFITTAVKMDKDEVLAIKEKLERQYGCTIEIENHIDPEIIGGVYLKIGDEATDGTVKGNFEKMRKELLNFSL